MASYEPLGGQLVSTYKENADRSGFLGKPVQARYVRTFKLQASTDLNQQISAALKAARASGWLIGEALRQVEAAPEGVSIFMGSLIVSGEKRLASGEVKQLSISVTTADSVVPGEVSPPAMRIRLTSPEISPVREGRAAAKLD